MGVNLLSVTLSEMFWILCLLLVFNPSSALFFGSNCGCQPTPCPATPQCPSQCPVPPPCSCGGTPPSNAVPSYQATQFVAQYPYQTSVNSQPVQVNPSPVQVQPVFPAQASYINPHPYDRIASRRISVSSSIYANGQVFPSGQYNQINEPYDQRVEPANRENEEFDGQQSTYTGQQAIYDGEEGRVADNEDTTIATTVYNTEGSYDPTTSDYNTGTTATTFVITTTEVPYLRVNDNEYDVNTATASTYQTPTQNYRSTPETQGYESKPVQDNEYGKSNVNSIHDHEYSPPSSPAPPSQEPYEEEDHNSNYIPEPAQIYQETNYYETTSSSPTVVTPTTIPAGFFSKEEDNGYESDGNSNDNNNNNINNINNDNNSNNVIQPGYKPPPGVELGIIVPQDQIEVTASPKPDYDDDYVNPAFLGEAVTVRSRDENYKTFGITFCPMAKEDYIIQ
ncbi:unnamed protein product [Bursaphelenchus xylophilus]|uniref:(pine wood nematode) hypothetical protein n=1 Tax=Bursaphelenchus xylophilus TaxID=6326 RepID=A0A1I7RS15_BURXY|nr:unnamed protein product [Bursaphelenchus xylophilus]CAG9123325.1 unnamed protein product [Bursaphelenchus xylophilus]